MEFLIARRSRHTSGANPIHSPPRGYDSEEKGGRNG